MAKKDVSKTMVLKDGVSGTLNRISTGTVRYKKNLQDLRNVGNKTWAGIRGGLSSLATSAAGAATAILGVASATSAIGFGVNVAGELESYRLTLETVLKDTKKAGELMRWASQFANITPFDTQEVVEGAVRLEAYGISAQATMRSIGDMAAVMNKDLMQAIEAVADAQTGELERMKEFGITKAMIQKKADEMFRNQIVINNKGQIVDQQKFNQALFALMDERFKGGMERQAKTFKGLMSTITGTWKTGLAEMMGVSAAGEIREGSLFAQLKSGAESFANTLNQMAESGTFQRIGDRLASILDSSVRLANFVQTHWSKISPLVYGIVGSLVAYRAAVIAATLYTGLKTKALQLAAWWTTFYGNAAATSGKKVGLLTLAQRGLNAAMRANPIGFVITLLGLLVTAGIYVVKNWETVKLAGMNTWNTVVAAAEWGVNKFVDFANFMLRGFKFAFDGIKFAGVSIWNDIVPAAERGIGALLKPLNSIRGALGMEAIKVDFSAAKFNAVAPTWSSDWRPIPKVNFGRARFSDDAIMAQIQRVQERAKQEEAKKAKNEDKLIKALEANTAAMENNTASTDSNTAATKQNTARLRENMSPVDIADSLLGRIERHLYGTT